MPTTVPAGNVGLAVISAVIATRLGADERPAFADPLLERLVRRRRRRNRGVEVAIHAGDERPQRQRFAFGHAGDRERAVGGHRGGRGRGARRLAAVDPVACRIGADFGANWEEIRASDCEGCHAQMLAAGADVTRVRARATRRRVSVSYHHRRPAPSRALRRPARALWLAYLPRLFPVRSVLPA